MESVFTDEKSATLWAFLTEMKSALTGLQTSMNFIQTEQAAIRQRLHELSNQLSPLLAIPDQMREMKSDHASLRQRMDTLDGIANRGRGALWAGAAIAGAVGSLIGLGVGLLKAFH